MRREGTNMVNNNTTSELLNKLLSSENEQLNKLNDIVRSSLKEQQYLTHKLRVENNVQSTLPERISDNVARFGGSWGFIISFTIIVILWVVLNTIILASKSFDPYPFILLNLFLSMLAAIQAPVILMSQNRQEQKDRKRAEHEYLINLKAEIEVRAIHEKIDQVIFLQLKEIVLTQQKIIEVLDKK